MACRLIHDFRLSFLLVGLHRLFQNVLVHVLTDLLLELHKGCPELPCVHYRCVSCMSNSFQQHLWARISTSGAVCASVWVGIHAVEKNCVPLTMIHSLVFAHPNFSLAALEFSMDDTSCPHSTLLSFWTTLTLIPALRVLFDLRDCFCFSFAVFLGPLSCRSASICLFHFFLVSAAQLFLAHCAPTFNSASRHPITHSVECHVGPLCLGSSASSRPQYLLRLHVA